METFLKQMVTSLNQCICVQLSLATKVSLIKLQSKAEIFYFEVTDLGSLIWDFDWKFSNFPATLILHESIFGWFQRVKNYSFNNFESFEFWFFEKFHTWKCEKFPKIQNSELLKWSKGQFLGFQNGQNWFHVESEWQKNHEISTLCIPNHAAQVCCS